jgi:hypothetical protein
VKRRETTHSCSTRGRGFPCFRPVPSRPGRCGGTAKAGSVFRCPGVGIFPKPVPDCVFPKRSVGGGETGLLRVGGTAGFRIPGRSTDRPEVGRHLPLQGRPIPDVRQVPLGSQLRTLVHLQKGNKRSLPHGALSRRIEPDSITLGSKLVQACVFGACAGSRGGVVPLALSAAHDDDQNHDSLLVRS